MNEIAK